MDQLIGIGIELWNMVTDGKVSRLGRIAAHHRVQAAPWN